jgi:ABC-type transport system involved in Fe-S cluster assembly fused permease/ATPase subunit
LPLPAQTKGEVRFEAVSFAYPSQPDRLILEDLDLTVQARRERGAGRALGCRQDQRLSARDALL